MTDKRRLRTRFCRVWEILKMSKNNLGTFFLYLLSPPLPHPKRRCMPALMKALVIIPTYQLLVFCMLIVCVATTYTRLGIFYLFLLLLHNLNVEKEWPHCPPKKNMPSYMDIYYFFSKLYRRGGLTLFTFSLLLGNRSPFQWKVLLCLVSKSL